MCVCRSMRFRWERWMVAMEIRDICVVLNAKASDRIFRTQFQSVVRPTRRKPVWYFRSFSINLIQSIFDFESITLDISALIELASNQCISEAIIGSKSPASTSLIFGKSSAMPACESSPSLWIFAFSCVAPRDGQTALNFSSMNFSFGFFPDISTYTTKVSKKRREIRRATAAA